ncbi:MAG: hypothetical protein JXR12_01300 [Neptunomonas phycophila]|uniref:hypothetical protein n=1 Tax=Neptunomonas phycophila TaxID=1572645 RepID=UPI003B8B1422
MIIDNIKLIDGSIQNAVVESGTALPATELTAGRIFFLTQVQGANAVGLYIYSGSEWVLFSSSAYVDSRIAEIVGTAPETLNSLSELATALGEDPDFILTINTKVDTETTRATAAENQIASDLSLETTRATTAESGLQTNIDAEVSGRQASDANLQTQIDAEVSARGSADTSFQTQIDNEISARTSADATKVAKAGDAMTGFLTLHADPTAVLHAASKQYVDTAKAASDSALTAETSRATAAEGSLQTDIDNETTRATTAESGLSTAISDEATRATAAEGSLQTQLNTETTERQNSDVTLQTAISNETTRATTAEGDLQTQIDAISGTGGSTETETAARIAADANLQTQVDANETAITTEVSDRTAADNAIQAQVTAIDNTDFLRGDIDDTMTGFLTLSKTPTAVGHAATKKYVDDQITAMVGGAPGALDTLNELATALNSDPSFATNITNQLSQEVTDRTNGDNALQGQIDAVEAAYSKRITTAVSSNHTVPSAQKGKNIQTVLFVDSSAAARSVTLPASPATGCMVSIIDATGSFGSNACTILRNGAKIMGIADDMIVNTSNASATLIYSGGTNGWRLVY